MGDLGWVFALVAFTGFLGMLLSTTVMDLSALKQTIKIKQTYFKALLRQDIAYMDEVSPGALQSRMAEDTDKIKEAMGDKLAEGCKSIFAFVAGTTVGFALSWKLALVLIAMIPFVILSVIFLFATIASIQPKVSAVSADAQGIAQMAMSTIRTVQSLQAQDRILDTYKTETAKVMNFMTGIHRDIAISLGCLFLTIYLCYALALWYGGQLVEEGELTGGEVIAILFAVLIGSFSLVGVAQSLKAVLEGRTSAGFIFQVIDRVPPIDSASDEGLKPEKCAGTLELRDVHFAYPARPEVGIFKGYSLRIEAGQTVALVGESGGGKSTVISLFERFYDPQQGDVLLDDTNIKNLNVQWLRSQISLVSQEPVLFATTILENIRFGKPDASDEEVMEAAKKANADGFIMSFPDKYKTDVGKGGIQLSGGQKQRVAIARAIIKDPTILMLDEATSALDSESEEIVQSALDELLKAKRRTTIIVAHRLSTVRNADAIAVIYDGRIVEKGTHDELATIPNGYFANLLKLQELGPSGGDEPEDAAKTFTVVPQTVGLENETEQMRDENGKQGTETTSTEEDINVLTVDLNTIDKRKLRALNKQDLLEKGNPMSRVWQSHTRGEMQILIFGLAGDFMLGACEAVAGMLLGLMLSAFYVGDEVSDAFLLCSRRLSFILWIIVPQIS